MRILSPEEARQIRAALDDSDFAERLAEVITAQVAMGSTIIIDGINLCRHGETAERKLPKSPTWRRGKAFCGGCGGCLENKEQHSSDIVSSIRFCKWCGTPVDWSNE